MWPGIKKRLENWNHIPHHFCLLQLQNTGHQFYHIKIEIEINISIRKREKWQNPSAKWNKITSVGCWQAMPICFSLATTSHDFYNFLVVCSTSSSRWWPSYVFTHEPKRIYSNLRFLTSPPLSSKLHIVLLSHTMSYFSGSIHEYQSSPDIAQYDESMNQYHKADTLKDMKLFFSSKQKPNKLPIADGNEK